MAEADVPDLYVDQFRTTIGAYGVAMSLGISPAHPVPGQGEGTKDLVRVRMSLEHAKVMVMILKRQLKRFEEETGQPVNIPRVVLNGLGLSSEDW